MSQKITLATLWAFVVAAVILFTFSMQVHAQTVQPGQQSDDMGFIQLNDGNRLFLNSQMCPLAGFMWWHVETPKGKTLQTGCWTTAGDHKSILVTDGKGNMWKIPMERIK